jgi:hypothetical protein
MADDFLSSLPIEPDSSGSNQPHRQPVKLLLIGSAEGVQAKIHLLHQRRVAEVNAWSPLLPVPNSSEVMSILVLYWQRE